MGARDFVFCVILNFPWFFFVLFPPFHWIDDNNFVNWIILNFFCVIYKKSNGNDCCLLVPFGLELVSFDNSEFLLCTVNLCSISYSCSCF